MSSNVMMTRFGKVLLPRSPCSIRPVSLVRKTCDSRRRVALRAENEDVVEAVAASDVVNQEAAINGSTAELTPVTFKVFRHVEFGQTVKVVGGAESLGSWQPDVAVPLTWMEGDVWTVDMELPSGPYEYKYLVIDGDGTLLEWYPGENLLADVTTDGVSLENQWTVPVAEPQPEEEEAPEETPIVGELAEEVETPEIETPTTSEIEEVQEVPEEEVEPEIEVEAVVEVEAEVEVEADMETEPEIVAEAETEIEAEIVSEAVAAEEEEQVEMEVEEEEEAQEEEDCIENAVNEAELETSAAVESVLDSEASDIAEPVVEEEEEKGLQSLSKGFGSPFFKRVKRSNKKN
ncbi:hypothetical protein BSKO_10142 [Bryopsis sp. KO-2023]|nr:hypothetical protein BSKO_10142 [Bryopsis sp. KO-2023]